MLYNDTKSIRDKRLLSLDREMQRLRKAKWNAPIIPLEKPYQKGWIRKFALRDDCLRRRDAHVFKDIIKKFNNVQYCRNKDFLDRDGNPIPHSLKILGKKQVESFNWPASHMKYLLLGHWSYNPTERIYSIEGHSLDMNMPTSWLSHTRIHGYVPSLPHYYIITVTEPYFVTHQRIIIPDVESRLQELENRFNRDNLWVKIGKLYGQRQRWHDYKSEHKQKLDDRKVCLDPEEMDWS